MLRVYKEIMQFYQCSIHSKDLLQLDETSTEQQQNSHIDLVLIAS